MSVSSGQAELDGEIAALFTSCIAPGPVEREKAHILSTYTISIWLKCSYSGACACVGVHEAGTNQSVHIQLKKESNQTEHCLSQHLFHLCYYNLKWKSTLKNLQMNHY